MPIRGIIVDPTLTGQTPYRMQATMKMKPIKLLAAAAFSFSLVLGAPDAHARKAPPLPELTQDGEQLKERYADMHAKLAEELKGAVPEVAKSRQAAYDKALEAEVKAKSDLEAAQKELGKISGAAGLVGHAKNHWIKKADAGIKASQQKIKNAKTPAEREAAEKELANWKQNRQDGVDALKERQANYDKLKKQEPKLKRDVEQAKKELEEAKARVAHAFKNLGLDSVLTSDKLDGRLAKFVVLNHGTPHRLAGFAQKDAEHKQLIDRLLSDDQLMLKMAMADGAEDGNYGRAMQIYTQILKGYPKASDGVFNRLALAIALEHATPIKQKNPAAAEDTAEQYVDPVDRYKHYEEAYVAGELDPYFDRHSAWALRFVVNGEEPNETLKWGRDMLRHYRPDHITTQDDRWRYVALVRTCVRYGSQENKYDKPELQFYQNILMNGGICGRRAFIGRFILRSFGVPTVAKPQKGHAALGRWTPDGWVAVLGAGWNTGWAPSREMAAIDFLTLTQARDTDSYDQVLRAYWIGDVHGETRKLGLNTGNHKPGFWNSVALNTQRGIVQDISEDKLAAVGEELGEANESKVEYPFESPEVREEDRKIHVELDGTIVIPAAATSSPTQSTGKIRFMESALGGMQLHYGRTGGDQDFTYSFEAPKAGKYNLVLRVATPSWKQHILIKANDAKPVEFVLPHTVGLFDKTEAIQVELVKGKNTLTFSRKGIKQEVAVKGITIKDMTLTPVERQN